MQIDLKEEIVYLSLGDKRRDKRFIKIVENKVSVPCASIPEMGEDWSDIKMTYEFYDNDKVSESRIACCIQQATVTRCLQNQVVLNLMDTTSINFSSGAAGLGYLDHGVGEGLMVHNSLAVDEQGCPLGLLSQKIWARDKSSMGKAKLRSGKAIREKESYRWIESMQQAEEVLKEVPLAVHIADRESDIYELFATPRHRNSELLIRATHDRKTLLGNSMWKEVQQQPVITSFELDIPKVTTEGMGKVKMEVRVSMVLLSPPSAKPTLPSLVMYGIVVKEVDKKENGLEWRLISTRPVNTAAEAKQCVQWYSYRWRIERFHYILKSGCRLEDLQLRTVKALRKAIVVYSLCAFKIMQMLYLSRTQPQCPCTNYFSDTEWKVLNSISSKSPVINHHPPNLQQCVKMIAKLGGYIGRNNDGPPGIKNLWRGLQKLHAILKAINNKNQWLSTN
jgi:hypothetical protein